MLLAPAGDTGSSVLLKASIAIACARCRTVLRRVGLTRQNFDLVLFAPVGDMLSEVAPVPGRYGPKMYKQILKC